MWLTGTDQYSVNPLYYVTFTTCTLTASFILFKGFNTSDAVNTISLLCGFLVIFSGVYLLNMSRDDPDGTQHISEAGGRYEMDGIPTDGLAAPLTRLSMQHRRSVDSHHRRSNSLPFSPEGPRRSQERLIHNFDLERQSMDRYALADLAEDEDDDDDEGSGSSSRKRTSFDRLDAAARINGRLSGSGARRANNLKLVEVDTTPVKSGKR